MNILNRRRREKLFNEFIMKILLVEDEVSIANLLIRGLKHEGHSVEHVTDGQEAIQKILNNSYDIVILDLLLPSMNGEDVVKAIRKEKNFTPVIVLTAVQSTETKIRLFNAGVDDFMTKPFSFLELITRIKTVQRRSNVNRIKNEELAIKDIVLNPMKHLVMRGDKKIPLRLKEFALLEYLMSHADEVISRNALVEKVWDYNAQIFSNTVDSHISILRTKINKGFKNKLIETIHGVGYVLRSD